MKIIKQTINNKNNMHENKMALTGVLLLPLALHPAVRTHLSQPLCARDLPYTVHCSEIISLI